MAKTRRLNLSRVKNLGSKPKKTITRSTKRVLVFVDNRPLTSFFVVLALLLAVIVIGNFLRKPQSQDEAVAAQVKEVQVFNIGQAPKVTVQAQIEKSGIVKITAQTPAIVSSVNVQTGDKVHKGTSLVNLSSNYSGSNPLSVARQIAAVQLKNIKETLPAQKELINKQKEVADKNKENFEKLRDITKQSIDETKSVISLNDEIISDLNDQLQTQTPGSSAYIATQSQISGFQSANNQLRQGLRNSEYQTNTDNPPTKMNDLANDIAKRQLDLQAKSFAKSFISVGGGR